MGVALGPFCCSVARCSIFQIIFGNQVAATAGNPYTKVGICSLLKNSFGTMYADAKFNDVLKKNGWCLGIVAGFIYL